MTVVLTAGPSFPISFVTLVGGQANSQARDSDLCPAPFLLACRKYVAAVEQEEVAVLVE
jgi:hypothetical protein